MSSFPASQMIAGGVFLLCAATTIAGALIAALTARIIRSVCGLAMCCLGLAGLYYFLHSPFLALMEILIYVGAVCVTIVFAVAIGKSLLTTYSLAFELISLALLVAIIGALAIARTGRTSAGASAVTEIPERPPAARSPPARAATDAAA